MRAAKVWVTHFNQAATGRERRMIELKQEVNGKAVQLGQPRPYALAFMDAAAEKVVQNNHKPGGPKSEAGSQKAEVSKTQKEELP